MPAAHKPVEMGDIPAQEAMAKSDPTGDQPPRPPRHLILQMRDCETDIINVINQEISSRGLNAYLMTYILKNVVEQIEKAAQTEITTVIALEQSAQ